MASPRQSAASRRNVKKAQAAARGRRTIAHLPGATRHDPRVQGAKGRRRGGAPGHALAEHNRTQLYELATARGIRGRSPMGKCELIEALRVR